MSPEDDAAAERIIAVLNKLGEAVRVASPILAKYGLKDDEAWGAYSQCVNASYAFAALVKRDSPP